MGLARWEQANQLGHAWLDGLKKRPGQIDHLQHAAKFLRREQHLRQDYRSRLHFGWKQTQNSSGPHQNNSGNSLDGLHDWSVRMSLP